MHKIIIILSIFLISACAEYRRKQDIEKCLEIGFEPGTEQFMNCQLQSEMIRAQRSVAAATWLNRKN